MEVDAKICFISLMKGPDHTHKTHTRAHSKTQICHNMIYHHISTKKGIIDDDDDDDDVGG